MGCYSPPPLKKKSRPEIEKECIEQLGWGGYLNGRKSG
jgi:hypothetical protein